MTFFWCLLACFLLHASCGVDCWRYQARKKREDALKEKGKDPFKQGLKRGKAEQGAGSKKKKKKKGGKTKKKTAASGKADGEAGKKKKSAGKAKTKKKKTAKSGKADGEL